MTDHFAGYRSTLGSPAAHAAEVVPSDADDLATYARRLYVGVSGNVRVTTVGGDTVTLKNAPVGLLDVRVSRVWSTGTTASDIVALW